MRSSSAVATLFAVATLVGPSLPAQGIAITTAAPASIGLDTAALRLASEAAERLPALTSLLVWRRGALGHELYLHGGARDRPANVKSVSKSVLSALVGIALAGEGSSALDRRIADLLPEYYTPKAGTLFVTERARSDSARHAVTIRHLLTMSSGMGWNEGDPILIYGLVTNSDPVRFAAELPMLAPPGSGFVYTTAGTHLLAGALARITGESNRDFGQRVLFGPAGIELAGWDVDPRGVHFGGAEMYFTTREMLKFGILYLQGGKAADRQVVPAEWVRESWRQHYAVATPAYRTMVPGLTGYGYLWWLRRSGAHPMMCALGFGGQFVLIVPDLELVTAGTSSLGPGSPGNEKQFNGIFAIVDGIVAATR